jgi:hypothetical protein
MTLEQIIQNSVAPVVIAAIFLWFMDRSEKQRSENAKALEQERRTHESTVFNLFATTMKQMIGEVTDSNERIMDLVRQHEAKDQERYERNKNTQEIMKTLNEIKNQSPTVPLKDKGA